MNRYLGRISPINTAASARCKDPRRRGQLFQQFAPSGENPLKRLLARGRLGRGHLGLESRLQAVLAPGRLKAGLQAKHALSIPKWNRAFLRPT